MGDLQNAWASQNAAALRATRAARYPGRLQVRPLFESRGYCWPTRWAGATVHGYAVDHVFARGLCDGTGRARAGVARDVKDASDHRPVWAVLGLGS